MSNNSRLAKNTLLLYIRTAFVMIVSLYTSRVVLNNLGVTDYGIYNVVGGFVAFLAVFTGSISNAITRFIAFELGGDDEIRLNKIFCTSINIQFILSIIIVIVVETVGLWFVNCKINIPSDRIPAAHWVLQCGLLIFVFSMMSVPYNACIVAHEKMSAFAYFSIIETFCKLLIAYFLSISPVDKLVTYSVLMAILSMIIREGYNIYSRINFKECHYEFIIDKKISREMMSFAGWNFSSNLTSLLNTQGMNILMNIYFGVIINTARGIATQVESIVLKFVNDFSVAITPQITKDYAVGEQKNLVMLICRGARFTYLLMIFLSLPLIFESEYVLQIWLGNVPKYSAVFCQLAIISTIVERFGGTLHIASMATGDIKKMVLFTNLWGVLALPITFFAYEYGMPPQFAYYVLILAYVLINIVRLKIVSKQIGFSVIYFVQNVILRCFVITTASIIVCFSVVSTMPSSFTRFLVVTFLSCSSVVVLTFFFGITKTERFFLTERIKNTFN